MTKTVSVLATVVLFFSCSPQAPTRSYLGVMQWDSKANPWDAEGNPLLGYLDEGRPSGQIPRWVSDSSGLSFPVEDLLSEYPIGRPLPGLAADGNAATVTLEGTWEPDGGLYGALLFGKVEVPNADSVAYPVLFWTGSPSFTLSPAIADSLSQIQTASFADAAQSVWSRAVAVLHPDDVGATFVFRQPQVRAVGSEGELLAVHYPIDIHWSEQHGDERGSFFGVFSAGSDSLLHISFSHPEWAPVDDSPIREVVPVLYVTLESDVNLPLMFGEFGWGWESYGHAIYDLRTGEILLNTY